MAWETAEQRREAAIHALGDPRRALEQLVGGLGVEPGIGPEEAQELGERPLEPCLPDHGLHLGADALHLVQTGAMNLFRRPIEGRVVPDEPGVVLATIRQLCGGDRRTRARDVLARHELEEPTVGRDHRPPDRLARRRAQALVLGRGDTGWEARERSHEHARLRRRLGVRPDRPVVPFEDDLGQREPVAEPRAHPRDLLVEVGGDGAQACQVVFIALHVGERDLLGQPRKLGVEPAVARDRETLRPQLGGAHRLVEPQREQVEVDPVGGRERGAVELPEPEQPRTLALHLSLACRGRDIREPVVVAVVAHGRGEQRIVGERPLPRLGDDRVEAGLGLAGRLRHEDRARHEQQDRRAQGRLHAALSGPRESVRSAAANATTKARSAQAQGIHIPGIAPRAAWPSTTPA